MSVVSARAEYSGEPQIIDNVFQDVLGVQPSAAQVYAEQASLAVGGTIANYESNLSQSSQGQAVIDLAFNDFGQLVPTGPSMQSAEAALPTWHRPSTRPTASPGPTSPVSRRSTRRPHRPSA